MGLGLFYVCLLLLGLVYALIAGLMGWLGDLGDGDIQVDASGHLDAGHPHPLSGTVIATFVTGFGGGGTLAHYLFDWPAGASLLFAGAVGLALAGAAFGVLELIFRQTQAGSEFAMEEVTGREAEVITAISAGGVGEVSYLVRGQRESCPARAADGSAIAKGSTVVIEKVMGNTVYVRPRSPKAVGESS
jgi:membrane protein implicated in regulation of membrane protease activity